MQTCDQVFNYKRHIAFGWVVHRKTLNVGESITVSFKEDTYTGEFNNITYFTKGHLTCSYSMEGYRGCRTFIDAGSIPALDDMLGTKFMPAGLVQTLTAVEPIEFWCFNYGVNKDKLPVVEKLLLEVDEEVTITDKRLFLCRGAVEINGFVREGPLELDIPETATLKAVSKCYGLYIHTLPTIPNWNV